MTARTASVACNAHRKGAIFRLLNLGKLGHTKHMPFNLNARMHAVYPGITDLVIGSFACEPIDTAESMAQITGLGYEVGHWAVRVYAIYSTLHATIPQWHHS